MEAHIESSDTDWSEWKAEEEKVHMIKARNHEIGMHIGRLCYFRYRKGHSERSFEMEVVSTASPLTDLLTTSCLKLVLGSIQNTESREIL